MRWLPALRRPPKLPCKEGRDHLDESNFRTLAPREKVLSNGLASAGLGGMVGAVPIGIACAGAAPSSTGLIVAATSTLLGGAATALGCILQERFRLLADPYAANPLIG